MKKTLFLLTLSLLIALNGSAQKVLKYSRVKVLAKNQTDFQTLMNLGISLESLEYKPGEFFIAEYSEDEINLLSQTNIGYQILIDDLSEFYQKRNVGIPIDSVNQAMKKQRNSYFGYTTPQNFSLGSMGGYHTYSELLQELDEMHTMFPNLISEKAPASSTLTIEGRTVYYVKISNNPTIEQNKPKVLYTALIHAREPLGMQQMLFQIWYLLENYSTNPEIQYLINNTEIFFIPCVNPDGYVYNQTTNPTGGGMWRKNRRDNGNGTFGIDLNRNFGYMWGYDNSGSSPNGSSETYRGTGPFSEPETQIIKHFCESHNIKLALNNHTYSNLLIYPWGYENLLTPDSSIFIEYAKRMTRLNGYRYGTCYQMLNYKSNGGSDDWFYGEQTTKNKILAFTPEAGDPADGFWPAVNKIESDCAGHSEMNLYLLRFALPFAEVEDLSPGAIASSQTQLQFKVKALGYVDNMNFTVSLQSLSPYVTSVSSPLVFTNMQTLDQQTGNFLITLKNNIAQGTPIQFVISTDNGQFIKNDTITKFYGNYQSYTDNCETMFDWISNIWNITSSQYVSPNNSITDSPSGNYSNNANNTITHARLIHLTNCADAYVEFYARWNLETNYDYVQFQVSEDNTNWIALPGIYTKNGSHAQGQPLWDDNSEWVLERISLNNFLGKSIKVRFRLVSDGSIAYDGFYFDNFSVKKLPLQTIPEFVLPSQFSFEQQSTLTVDFKEYITTYSYNNLSLNWSGNENIGIDTSNFEVTFSGLNPSWSGTELISFYLNYPNGQIEQQTTVEIRAATQIENPLAKANLFYSYSEKRLKFKNWDFSRDRHLTIYNLVGNIVLQHTITDANFEVDLSCLGKGVYVVKTQHATHKVIIL
ncbi:MAG TPA: M14 family zinc carboxypeptidase [Salinivirgaceae bacterium]|nr:M14 family zinc carboxypeptidase [Salinivirgaceae bacterium]